MSCVRLLPYTFVKSRPIDFRQSLDSQQKQVTDLGKWYDLWTHQRSTLRVTDVVLGMLWLVATTGLAGESQSTRILSVRSFQPGEEVKESSDRVPRGFVITDDGVHIFYQVVGNGTDTRYTRVTLPDSYPPATCTGSSLNFLRHMFPREIPGGSRPDARDYHG
jgi:hypothetical protein